jgi:hypothetical protein
MRIIVRDTGELPGFLRGVLLRVMVPPPSTKPAICFPWWTPSGSLVTSGGVFTT